MPPRPRTSRRRPVSKPRPAASSAQGPVFEEISAEDKARIGELMKEHLGFPHDPWEMQSTCGVAQVDGDDVVAHAPTGRGKTGIVAAPHAFPQNKGRVTIFVSPLIALQEEMVTTFKEEFRLSAVAVNSTRTKSLKATMQDICAGKYAIVLISPEMLQSRRFVDGVLRNNEFYRRVLSLVVDEAHTVSHWGAHFRKKYSSLGVVRAFLPPKTSVVAMSASFTPRVRRDVLKKLQFGPNYINIDEGNNRPNVAIVVRACHRQLGSFADLDFVIPSGVQTATDIPSTFVYCDKKEEGDAIIDHLRELLPEPLRDQGLIRPFNASLSHRYRKNALAHFRAGNIRVMVCTDAAGMGCNIPNIEVVVQWRLPEKLSMFVQRAGRAARRSGTAGLAVLLVEPTAYTEFIDRSFVAKPPPVSARATTATEASTEASAKPSSAKAGSKPGTRTPRGYAKAHGRNRGCDGSETSSVRDADVCLEVDEEAEDEGLLCLVQTGDCRRRVIADAFANHKDRSAHGPCCDLCDPSLLKRTLPGRGPKRKPRLAKKDKDNAAPDVIEALYDWRMSVWEEDLQYTGFSDVALLSDDRIHTLARVLEFETERTLHVEMGEWRWWSRYGKSLWHALGGVYNARAAEVQPAPQPATTRTRGAPATSSAASSLPPSAAQTSSVTSAPTSVPPALSPAPPAAVKRKRGADTVMPTPTSNGPSPAQSSSRAAATATSGPSAAVTPLSSSSAPSGGSAKRQRTSSAVPTAQPLTVPPRPPPPSGPRIHLEQVPLSPGATIPRVLRDRVPVPVPTGPADHPSRVVPGPDHRLYFASVDGQWFKMPPGFFPAPARGGPGGARGRGRGRGGRGVGA